MSKLSNKKKSNKKTHKKKHRKCYKKTNSKLYSIKVRLYPKDSGKLYASKNCGARRFVYNYLLAYVRDEHKRKIDNINAVYENYIFYNEPIPESFDFTDEYCDINLKFFNSLINDLKVKKEYKWINDTPAKVIQQAINDLLKAFDNFFNHGFGFPKFKKKNRSKESHRFIDQAIKGGKSKYGIRCIKGNRLTINDDFKNILFKCSRKDEKYLNKYQSLIHSITISKTKTLEYYASILIERVEKAPAKTGAAKGLDMGIKDFYTDSSGNKEENLHWLKKCLKNIKRLQRELNRKEKGSKNREKARVKLARAYEKITNKRNNHHHKLTKGLVMENDILCIEDLNIAGMMKNHKLALSIQELAWGEFYRQLEYKCERYDKKLVKVDRFFASSKLCNHCGYKKTDLKLSDRVWTCPDCGTVIDRDVNAAKNILEEGLRILKEQETENKA